MVVGPLDRGIRFSKDTQPPHPSPLVFPYFLNWNFNLLLSKFCTDFRGGNITTINNPPVPVNICLLPTDECDTTPPPLVVGHTEAGGARIKGAGLSLRGLVKIDSTGLVIIGDEKLNRGGVVVGVDTTGRDLQGSVKMEGECLRGSEDTAGTGVGWGNTVVQEPMKGSGDFVEVEGATESRGGRGGTEGDTKGWQDFFKVGGALVVFDVTSDALEDLFPSKLNV